MHRLIRDNGPHDPDYFEVWRRGNVVVVHTGSLGDKGTVGEIPAASPEDVEQIISSEIRAAKERGFRDLDPSEFKELVVQYQLDDSPLEEQVRFRHAVEERANQTLGWYGFGRCTGGDIGGGKMNVVCKVLNPDEAAFTLLSELAPFGFDEGAVVATWTGDSYRVIYPFKYDQTFRL
jgi:hypothetical protein